MSKPNFYYRREDQEFLFRDKILVRVFDNKEISILDMSDQSDNKEFLIIEVIEHKHYSIILCSWILDRNILCLDRDTNQIVWRIPTAKQIWNINPNAWSRIFIKAEEPEVVYCRSVDSYIAGFKIETGEMIFEHIPTDPDPRDM